MSIIEKEFQVNEYLKLRMEGKKTVIYVGEQEFSHCLHLFIDDIRGDDILDYQDQVKEIIEEMQHTSVDEKASNY